MYLGKIVEQSSTNDLYTEPLHPYSRALLFVRYINPFFGMKLVLISPLVDVFDPRRLLPPVIVLSVRPMAFVAQATISSLQDVIRTDYVRTAHAKGLLPWTVLSRHILRNISTPVLTAVNSSFFFALSVF